MIDKIMGILLPALTIAVTIVFPIWFAIWFIKKGWKYPTRWAAKVYKYFKEETKK